MTRTERRHHLAALIRAAMAEHNITQAQLAEIFDVDKGVISRRYHGEYSWAAEDLLILADVFGAPFSIHPPALAAAGG
jgi:transcriptional regulator with XRE-family HTH domain